MGRGAHLHPASLEEASEKRRGASLACSCCLCCCLLYAYTGSCACGCLLRSSAETLKRGRLSALKKRRENEETGSEKEK